MTHSARLNRRPFMLLLLRAPACRAFVKQTARQGSTYRIGTHSHRVAEVVRRSIWGVGERVPVVAEPEQSPAFFQANRTHGRKSKSPFRGPKDPLVAGTRER